MKSLILLILGGLGLLAAVHDTAQFMGASASSANPPLGENPLFELMDKAPHNSLLSRPPRGGVFSLRKGDAFKLAREETAKFRFNSISFSLLLHAGDVEELHFRATRETGYVLRLSRDPARDSGLFFRGTDGRVEALTSLGKETFMAVMQEEGWIRVKLFLFRNEFSLQINDSAPIAFQDPRLMKGAMIFCTFEGSPGLDRISFEAFDGDETLIAAEEFRMEGNLLLSRPSGRLMTAFFLWVFLILAYGIWLSLPGRLSFPTALFGLLRLFPISLLLWLVSSIGIWTLPAGWAAAAPLFVGFLMGLVYLPRLRFSDEATATGDGKRGYYLRPVLTGCCLAVLLFGSFAPILREYTDWEVGEPPGVEEEKTRLAAPYASSPPFPLDLSNEWSPGRSTVRDFIFEGEIRLMAESLCEIGFRKLPGMNWNALQISTMEDMGCQWLDSTRLTFQRIAGAHQSIPAQQWIPFRIEARGCRLNAAVNGEALPVRVDGSPACGTLTVLVYRGAGSIRNLVVKPLPAKIEGMPLGYGLRKTGWPAAILLLLFAAYTVFLSAGRRLPALRLAVMDGIAHLPLMGTALAFQMGFFRGSGFFAAGTGLMVLARMAPVMANGTRLGRLSLLPGFLVPAFAGIIAYLALAPPPSPEYRANNLRLYDFTPPLREDLLWYQIPKLRRSSQYVQNHLFRDRRFSLAREPGTFRIVCMGSSSTFGHLLPLGSAWDFPTVLETVLTRRYPDRAFEVMNAGIQGGNATVVREFYRGVIRHFKPDLLIINLFYNDAYIQTLLDEYEYLQGLKERSFEQGCLQRMLAEARLSFRWILYNRYSKKAREGEEYPRSFFARGAGPFKRFVLDTVDSAGEDGASVLLVKEPFHEGRGALNYEAFYEALESVGQSKGVPVIEPLAMFREKMDDLSPLFLDGVHLTRLGNRVMAEFLADECERLRLLKSDRSNWDR